MIRAVALLAVLTASSAWAEPKAPVSPEQMEEIRQRVRTFKQAPYLLNRDGTPHRPGQPASTERAGPRPPAEGSLGDWFRFAHRVLTRR